jgi:small conductance mechanosensitive channel
VTVPTKGAPHVSLEEFDGDEIVVRIRATPANNREGGRLAGEILNAVAALPRTGNGAQRSGAARASGGA